MSQTPPNGTRLERTLSSGAHLAVEVFGVGDQAAWAERAIDAAARELGRAGVELAASHTQIPTFAGIVGNAGPMKELFRMLERIRASDATIIITGENGTGKELVAKAIHQQSRRAQKRFVATNCSAFNDNLLESELFGHRRGAFTGAVLDKPGLFEVADGGTFLLDEVGDMSPALQVKLLRVLQEGTFMPVGATEVRKVDVRIVAATNRDLAAMVQQGQFREDLYYRLHVVALKVPPLRERREDIPALAAYFLDKLSARDGRRKSITARALDQLVAHRWPGNVRELENEIERMWVLSGEDTVIDVELLSENIKPDMTSVPPASAIASSPPPADSGARLPDAVEALERRMIMEGLRRARGNKTRAAEELGISRRNLIRKVQAYRIGDDFEG